MKVEKRLTISIDEKMHSLVSRLAKHWKCSKSSVIRQVLDVGRDSLGLMADGLDAAHSLELDERSRIASHFEKAMARVQALEQEALAFQDDMRSELDRRGGEGAAGDHASPPSTAAPADPRIVTRGFTKNRGGTSGPLPSGSDPAGGAGS